MSDEEKGQQGPDQDQRQGFFAVQTADGLVELPWDVAKKLGYIQEEVKPTPEPVSQVSNNTAPPLMPDLTHTLTVEQQAQKLGLRHSLSMDDTGPDVYSSIVWFDNKPVFIMELSDEDKAEMVERAAAIEQKRLAANQTPPPPEDEEVTPEVIMHRALEQIEKNKQNSLELQGQDLAFYSWILERTFRGALHIKDWRKLWPSQKAELAERIRSKSTVGRDDLELLLGR